MHVEEDLLLVGVSSRANLELTLLEPLCLPSSKGPLGPVQRVRVVKPGGFLQVPPRTDLQRTGSVPASHPSDHSRSQRPSSRSFTTDSRTQ